MPDKQHLEGCASYASDVAGISKQLVVGFDLDMTLIDPRRSVRSTLKALADESGKEIDIERIVSNLGPPLETALSPYFAGDELENACWRYRDLFGTNLVDNTDLMPGAAEAIENVRSLGGKVFVVTAKYEPHARASLETVGIDVEVIVGWRYGPAKGDAILEHAAQIYVGDHPADILAARAGRAVAVAVATGATSAIELQELGADTVLSNLLELPAWLGNWVRHNT